MCPAGTRACGLQPVGLYWGLDRFFRVCENSSLLSLGCLFYYHKHSFPPRPPVCVHLARLFWVHDSEWPAINLKTTQTQSQGRSKIPRPPVLGKHHRQRASEKTVGASPSVVSSRRLLTLTVPTSLQVALEEMPGTRPSPWPTHCHLLASEDRGWTEKPAARL